MAHTIRKAAGIAAAAFVLSLSFTSMANADPANDTQAISVRLNGETLQYPYRYDKTGAHFDWTHDGVTARQIDWFWSNMEKGFILWHPEQHEPLEWPVPVKNGNPLGAIHNAPQTWSDGKRQNLYIRFEKLEDVPAEIRELIIYEHVIVVAGLGFDEASIKDPKPLGYRVHQWQKTDQGVVGRSSAIGTRKKESAEDGLVWAKHAGQEIANWGAFLPQVYNLYRVVKDEKRNPFSDLSVEGTGRDAVYKHIK
ncbi:hypothetical protein ABRZ24_13200 [Brenneria populi]|uniref:Uncharacterized protein n=1 Tax=Brenneria populi TaxID=1505588 RepID=A0ABU6JTF8_9GAMM|nr:hypothetical protein [Brenneria populi Li et al. 2015]